ncbi:MAG: DUF1801 domain-containing protein [Sneathiellales bacterium]|nr:DUF1801 domain-containing protein [Sneathiellales bacterium]
MTVQFDNLEIAALYQSYPDDVRSKLLALRAMVFDLAAQNDEIGTVTECLKWGTPSYETARPKSGTPLRLQWVEKENRFGLFVHCQTNLVSRFKKRHADLVYDKNRGLLCERDKDIPAEVARDFILSALTYYRKS